MTKWTKVQNLKIYEGGRYRIRNVYGFWECFYRTPLNEQVRIGDANTLKEAKEICEKHQNEQ